MRFDAYAGNVRGSSPEEVATMCAWSISGKVERGSPIKRHTDVFQVLDGTSSVGWVGYDQYNDLSYFEFKGERTPDVSGSIRKHWPLKHTVSRIDSCEDYNDPEAYERLSALMDSSADPRVKSREIRPRRGSDDGRTAYWGSKNSQVMVRVYEAGLMKERRIHGRPHWVRAEAQVRPSKAIMKQAASQCSPLDVWGFAAWSTRAAERMAQVEVQRFTAPSSPVCFDRSTLYIARAHRRHLEEMLATFGDWECVGREFAAIWQADDEAESDANR